MGNDGKGQGANGKTRRDDAIYVRLVDQLYGTVGALVSGIVATAAVALVCWIRTDQVQFLICAWSLIAVVVLRLGILGAYRHAKADSAGWTAKRMRRWELAYIAGAVFWGAALGLTTYYGAQSQDVVVQRFCDIIAIGIVGGSAGRNAARPNVVLIQIAVLLGPYSVGLWQTGMTWDRGILLLVACLAVSVRSSTRSVNASLVSAMTKQTELEVTNAHFETTLTNISQGLCLVRGDLEVLVVNERFNEILGAGAVVGRTLGEASPDLAATVRRLVADLASGNRETRRQRTADGRLVEFRADSDGDDTVIVVEDVTERDAAERRIAHLASHDALTDLPNARMIIEEIQGAVVEAAAGEAPFAVLALDLDKFKEVNDTLGHPVGDELLRAVAGRLRECARSQDVVARIGGDEFVVVMRGGDPTLMAERMIDAIAKPYGIDGNEIRIGVSIGIAAWDDGAKVTELRRRADMALYQAKADPVRRHCTYRAEMGAVATARRAMAADLKVAIAEGDLIVHFQPIVDVARNRVVCCEALVRWSRKNPDGTRTMVRPDQFIGLAEERGLIVPLGGVVLRKACLAAANWPAGIKVAVNVSALQMRGDILARQVRDALLASGLPGHRLELEITESQSMEDIPGSRRIMADMAAMGVSIALDDFGTGRSSLAYLHELDFGKVKVDRSFMRAALENEGARALVRMIAAFAKATGKSLVIEGVETREELCVMQGLGVDLIQGYLFSKPIPDEDLHAVLARFEGAVEEVAPVRHRPAQLVALAGGKRT